MIVAALVKTGQSTFDNNGRAEVRMAPERPGQKWNVRRVVISTTSQLRTTAATYRDSETAANKLDTSARANDDTSEDNSYLIYSGGAFICVWNGGTPGAVATLNLLGDIER